MPKNQKTKLETKWTLYCIDHSRALALLIVFSRPYHASGKYISDQGQRAFSIASETIQPDCIRRCGVYDQSRGIDTIGLWQCERIFGCSSASISVHQCHMWKGVSGSSFGRASFTDEMTIVLHETDRAMQV